MYRITGPNLVRRASFVIAEKSRIAVCVFSETIIFSRQIDYRPVLLGCWLGAGSGPLFHLS